MIKYKNKKEKGITLVALVITIIILLILAGISIQTLTQTGLFENAKQAKNATENAQKDENTTLTSYEKEIEQYVEELTPQKKYIYLYNKGDECTENSGGWGTPIGLRTSAWTSTRATLNSNCITLTEVTPPGEWAHCGVYTRNKIDFSKYSKLYIEYECEEPVYSMWVQCGTSTDLQYEYTGEFKAFYTDTKKGKHVAEIDTTEDNWWGTGSCSDEKLYIKILLYTNSTSADANGNANKVNITKVYLEPKE